MHHEKVRIEYNDEDLLVKFTVDPADPGGEPPTRACINVCQCLVRAGEEWQATIFNADSEEEIAEIIAKQIGLK